MAVFYNEGENKIRPGVYQRHVNIGNATPTGAKDGICAIPIQASWGPLGKVVTNTNVLQLTQNYGSGTYGSGYTVPAAAAMFEGGAAIVYTYRLGTGGTKASKAIATGLTATALYPGTMPISVSVQDKLGYNGMKQFNVYAGTTLVETFEFAANTTTEVSDGDGGTKTTTTSNVPEGANLIAAAAGSKYVSVALNTDATAPTIVPILEVAAGALTGGANPTVTNADYSAAFEALEPYYYNTIALDVDDDANLTLSLLLQEYLDNAYQYGKLGIAVVGE